MQRCKQYDVQIFEILHINDIEYLLSDINVLSICINF